MSTHATIAAVIDGNNIMVNRIGYDGYLDHTGRALLKYFNDSASAIKLASTNEVRSVDLDSGKFDCYEPNEFYPYHLGSIFDWYKSMPAEEYNYIFIDGKWYLYSPAKLIPLQGEDEYDGTMFGAAQIVPYTVSDDDDLTKRNSKEYNKSLVVLAKKALKPVDGHCRLGLYNRIYVRITGKFNLEYDLDSDMYRYSFFDSLGLASIIYNSVVKHYEELAEDKQCKFKKEEEQTVVKVMKYWDKIIGFDRAKYVTYDEDYLQYFLDALGGMDTEYSASKMEWHKKGYVQKKIDSLISSMSDEEKHEILSVFTKESSWDEHISASPVFDYKDNLQKYGTGYKDMKEELKKDENYIKMCELRDAAEIKCRESFLNQVSKMTQQSEI